MDLKKASGDAMSTCGSGLGTGADLTGGQLMAHRDLAGGRAVNPIISFGLLA